MDIRPYHKDARLIKERDDKIMLAVDEKFKDIMPALAPKEKVLLEENKLGFTSFYEDDEIIEDIIIIPSKTKGYWLISIETLPSGITTYTKKPMAFGTILYVIDNIEKHKLEPIKHEPVPDDYFVSIEYAKNRKENRITNVYVIQANIGGPVKIGISNNIQERIAQFQAGCPFPLVVIKVYERVAARLEIELHKIFYKYRLHGEWFSEEVLGLLDSDKRVIKVITKYKQTG